MDARRTWYFKVLGEWAKGWRYWAVSGGLAVASAAVQWWVVRWRPSAADLIGSAVAPVLEFLVTAIVWLVLFSTGAVFVAPWVAWKRHVASVQQEQDTLRVRVKALEAERSDLLKPRVVLRYGPFEPYRQPRESHSTMIRFAIHNLSEARTAERVRACVVECPLVGGPLPLPIPLHRREVPPDVLDDVFDMCPGATVVVNLAYLARGDDHQLVLEFAHRDRLRVTLPMRREAMKLELLVTAHNTPAVRAGAALVLMDDATIEVVPGPGMEYIATPTGP